MKIGSILLELTLGIYPHFQPIAFQWVRGGLCYVTTQRFCRGNTLNFNGQIQRRGLFSRFFLRRLLKDRARSFLSCRYHYHDTDGFFHLCWYWLFSICNRYQEAQQRRGCVPCNQHGTVSMTPRRGIRYSTHFELNQNLSHTLGYLLSVISEQQRAHPDGIFVIAANLVSPNFTNTPNVPGWKQTWLCVLQHQAWVKSITSPPSGTVWPHLLVSDSSMQAPCQQGQSYYKRDTSVARGCLWETTGLFQVHWLFLRIMT